MKNETFKVELREGHTRKGGGGMSGRQRRWWRLLKDYLG